MESKNKMNPQKTNDEYRNFFVEAIVYRTIFAKDEDDATEKMLGTLMRADFSGSSIKQAKLIGYDLEEIEQ